MNSIRASRAATAIAALAVAFLTLSACGVDDGGNPDPSGGDGAVGDGAGDGDQGGGGGDSPPPAPPSFCFAAEECVPVPSTCCECPTFAVPIDDFVDACGQVECGEPESCPAVQPVCIEQSCQLVCSPIEARSVCDNGFESDAFGCLIDSCRGEAAELRACAGDDECSEVPADCCGCMLGGADTAVATSQVDGYLESLSCESDAECPDIDVCDESLIARCVARSCALGPPDRVPPGALGSLCGVPDYPSCAEGLVCVLNHPEAGDATGLGVGSCRPSPDAPPAGAREDRPAASSVAKVDEAGRRDRAR